jgi:hypothetical protein
VPILGESGTGKELIARALHERIARAHRALVKANCASIPRDLFADLNQAAFHRTKLDRYFLPTWANGLPVAIGAHTLAPLFGRA